MHRNIMLAIVACLEIIQPGIWIFFQVGEWDLNIGGKFQANWRDGVIMKINKMDVTSLSVNFPGVTSLVRSQFVRTTLT
nr:agenet-like domain-containing protein [Tanacetum cinerariifolium]